MVAKIDEYIALGDDMFYSTLPRYQKASEPGLQLLSWSLKYWGRALLPSADWNDDTKGTVISFRRKFADTYKTAERRGENEGAACRAGWARVIELASQDERFHAAQKTAEWEREGRRQLLRTMIKDPRRKRKSKRADTGSRATMTAGQPANDSAQPTAEAGSVRRRWLDIVEQVSGAVRELLSQLEVHPDEGRWREVVRLLDQPADELFVEPVFLEDDADPNDFSMPKDGQVLVTTPSMHLKLLAAHGGATDRADAIRYALLLDLNSPPGLTREVIRHVREHFERLPATSRWRCRT